MSTPEQVQVRQPAADPASRKERRTTGVAKATGGMLLLLGGLLLLRLVGVASFPLASWGWASLITAAVMTTLWLIPQVGLDDRLTWDPHYVILPLILTAALLNLYVYIAPELRVLPLLAWPTALLFMVGLVGFVGVMGTSLAMALGYLYAVHLLVQQGAPLSMVREAGVAFGFLAIAAYAGTVFQRLRRQRSEMRQLRRQLSELALTDPLTGLPNRRQFEDILVSEVARVGRYGGQCCLAMIDVDHFKTYNDTLGHPAGDAALRELAQVMRRHLRVTDVLARYGGEEFALIMVNTPKTEAVHAMDRLRATIAEYPFRDEHVLPEGRLTFSVGVSSCPTDTTEYHDLVKLADDALYLAKRGGRNQVHAAGA
ncbi:MAG TPA: GGDEF domain-containing protein [Longimicrobiales bacterium]|nr:GGDEF domain-containing protein [Longimicrobiales bacterium]